MTVNLNAVQNPQIAYSGETRSAAEQPAADFGECVRQAVLNVSGQKPQVMVNTKATAKASSVLLEGILQNHGEDFKFFDENGIEMPLFLQFAIHMIENPLPPDTPRIPFTEDNELAQEFMAMMLSPGITLDQLIAHHQKMIDAVMEEQGAGEEISVYGLFGSDSREKSQQYGSYNLNYTIENAHFSKSSENASYSEALKMQSLANSVKAEVPQNLQAALKAAPEHYSEIEQTIFGNSDSGEKAAPTQIEQALSELMHSEDFSSAKVSAESAEELIPQEQSPFETVKVDIKAKPEEFNQLQQFKEQAEVQNSDKPLNAEKQAVVPEKTDKPLNAEKQAVIPEKTENAENKQQNQTASEAPRFVIIPKTPKAQLNAKEALLTQTQIRSITEEIIARITTTVKRETTFEMTLNPAKLGKITIKLVMESSEIFVKITAEKTTTAQMLQSSVDRIAQALERSETRFESFYVTVEQKPDYPEQQNRRNQDGRQDCEPERTDEEESIEISFAELIQSM